MKVNIGLELGDTVFRGVDRSHTGSIIALPELDTLVGRRTTGAGDGRGTLRLHSTLSIVSFTVSVTVSVDG